MPTREIMWVMVLCILAGATWWWAEQAEPEAIPEAVKSDRQFDYYVRQLEVITTGPDGKPTRTLRSDGLKHFPRDDTTELQRPHLRVHQPDTPPWNISASHGWMNGDGSLVLLTGGVRIERAADARHRPVTLVTESLRVQPREDYAETDEPVRVTSRDSWVEAVGMQAWLRPPVRIKLLSEARAHYVQPQTPAE